MKEASMVGSLTIYDDEGRIIRKLAKNELLATKGQFIWDGISDDQSKANIGTHIAVFEVFNLNGTTVFVKKQAFVVAGKI
jgi:flagellar hook assembly protein FlgD